MLPRSTVQDVFLRLKQYIDCAFYLVLLDLPKRGGTLRRFPNVARMKFASLIYHGLTNLTRDAARRDVAISIFMQILSQCRDKCCSTYSALCREVDWQ